MPTGRLSNARPMKLRAVAVALVACSVALGRALPAFADTPIDSTFGAGFRTFDARATPDDFVGIVVRSGGQILVGGQTRRPNDIKTSHTDPVFIQRNATGG